MARKALRTHHKLREKGPVELWLYSNPELEKDEPLGELRDPKTYTLRHVAKRLLDGEHTNERLLAAVTKFHEHLGCDREEFLALLRAWKFKWSYGIPEAEERAKMQMLVSGMRNDGDAVKPGVAFIGGLQTGGVRTLAIDELRSSIDALKLEKERSLRSLSVAAIDVEHNAVTAQVALDLQDAFEGRTGEQARGLDQWEDIDRRLKEGLQA